MTLAEVFSGLLTKSAIPQPGESPAITHFLPQNHPNVKYIGLVVLDRFFRGKVFKVEALNKF